MTTSKVTISLPADLLERLDTLAKERGVSRSGVIAEMLARWMAELEEQSMAEGYMALAGEALAFAEGGVDAAREALPQWK
ncbi:MAG: ribbon-helix-helix protein, CopG family [Chloroflexi bacterium]|nr:ribbon-helix-helix protein, CopG family [Chloroflexota bacterium]